MAYVPNLYALIGPCSLEQAVGDNIHAVAVVGSKTVQQEGPEMGIEPEAWMERALDDEGKSLAHPQAPAQ